MDKFCEMSRFRKIMLILMAAMVLGFGIAAPILHSRPGIEYKGSFLRMEAEGDTTRFSGRVDGEAAVWTVHPGGIVEHRWGDCVYGPYQVVEDLSARPDLDHSLTGIEIRRGDEVLFRGGYTRGAEWSVLYQQDGEPIVDIMMFAVSTNGLVIGADGPIAPEELHEPSLSSVARIAMGDEDLVRRGSFGSYLLVTLLAALNIVQILFPKWFFRRSIIWTVRDPDRAEPSDIYVLMQKVEWVFLAIVTFALYWWTLTGVWR